MVNSTAIRLTWSNINVSGADNYRVVVQRMLHSGPVMEHHMSLNTTSLIVNGLGKKPQCFSCCCCCLLLFFQCKFLT